MVMQIRRTATASNPPTGLAQGQLAVGMADTPPSLWVGVPASISASLRAQINPLFSQTGAGLVPAPGASTPATYVLQANGTWAAVGTGGGGTVTSVAMTVPSGLAVSGSPVTTNGTLAVTWSGTVPNAQIPAPTASALGGVISSAAPSNQFATGITTAGAVTYAQPAFSNLSGNVTLAQLPAIANDTVLGNVSGATAPPSALTQAQLTVLVNPFTSTLSGAVPAPGASTPATDVLQANGTWAPVATGGGGTVTSVAMTVPSGLAVAGSPITTNGTLGVTWSGTIPNAQIPAPTASALGGVTSASAPAGQFVTGVTTAGALIFGTPAAGGVVNVNVQTFTASGTYTPSANLLFAMVECWGGGGGGGAVVGGNGVSLAGGGGGSGGYSRSVLMAATIGASQSVTIGAGGTAGSGGSGSAGNGGPTQFGTLVLANGGSGALNNAYNAGTGAALGTGQLALRGTSGVSGSGGNSNTAPSFQGLGAGNAVNTSNSFGAAVAGAAAIGVGAGGNGACIANASGSAAGGAGAAGLCVVTEYLSA